MTNLSVQVNRLSQKLQKTGESFWAGYITYHTKEYPQFIIHFWKLDSDSIKILVKDMNNKSEKKIKEIPLNSIIKVRQSGIDVDEFKTLKHLFSLETNDDVYFCGDGKQSENSAMNSIAKQFFNIFKMVYLPYTSRSRL